MKASIAVPITALLVVRAGYRKSLTPAGIIAAIATAVAHVVHPWSVFYAFLVVFFIAGTAVTRVKHDVKKRLTLSASGEAGGEGARTHIQVLANSLVASVLILLHARQLKRDEQSSWTGKKLQDDRSCWEPRADILVPGIIANYAAVAADTFSSELGILSKSRPRLITSLSLRHVPPGTNGGVTLWGLVAGLIGAFTIALTSILLLPFCPNTVSAAEKLVWVVAITIWGGLGSVLDSLLGGWLQASIVDVRSGKVVEGSGGGQVLLTSSRSAFSPKTGSARDAAPIDASEKGSSTARDSSSSAAKQTSRGQGPERTGRQAGPASRKLESGLGVLDNNAVNFLMALMMSVGAVLASAWYWGVPLSSVL